MKTYVAVALAAFTVTGMFIACGGGATDLCRTNNVRCESSLSCDPNDGVCKCGGRGGVVCGSSEVCDTQSGTCLSTLCGSITCAKGTACDGVDGKCKCGGTFGAECAAGEFCQAASRTCTPAATCDQVSCAENESCDLGTGECVCGNAACPSGQACVLGSTNEKTCVNDACFGVKCNGNTSCDPTDGYCKCNGAICNGGERCGCPDGGASCADTAQACQPSSICDNVTCNGGAQCDPADGQCKCGGAGGPVCTAGQICNLNPRPQCQGGQQCNLPDGGVKSCTGGTSCDPEDGKCKCGGRGGTECLGATENEPAEICIANSIQQSCRRPCTPHSQDCREEGKFCYFDSSLTAPAAYCAVPTGTRKEGESCSSAAACFLQSPTRHSLHCAGLAVGVTGFCREYCDTNGEDTAVCKQSDRPQECINIPEAPLAVGICVAE